MLAHITGTKKESNLDEVISTVLAANSIIIVPGYGMAVSRAQNSVGQLVKNLRNMGKNVKLQANN